MTKGITMEEIRRLNDEGNQSETARYLAAVLWRFDRILQDLDEQCISEPCPHCRKRALIYSGGQTIKANYESKTPEMDITLLKCLNCDTITTE